MEDGYGARERGPGYREAWKHVGREDLPGPYKRTRAHPEAVCDGRKVGAGRPCEESEGLRKWTVRQEYEAA